MPSIRTGRGRRLEAPTQSTASSPLFRRKQTPVTSALARNASPGKPRSRFYQLARRIARRFEPAVAAAFMDAITKLQRQIDEAALRQAIASGNLAQIQEAIETGGHLGTILDNREMERALYGASTATGRAGADILSGVTGLTARFNALDPNVVLFARQQAAELVVAVTEDVREAIRIVTALAQEQGLTTVQQARALREVVGLPPNWAAAPSNLARELREGAFTETRRMSAADKAQIRSRLARGTVDEPFIARMQGRYASSLINRRALNIARTETLRASHHGQLQEWKQATRQGVLPKTARRMWIVTPDDRLRETHAAIPGMNPGGIALDGVFQTPLGPSNGPPLETNCRCGEGLIFPGYEGVL
jgi:hypothetical protein